VHFFEDDAVFIDSLSEFVGGVLGSGGACIVIATQDHRRSLDRVLRDNGIEIRKAAIDGRYITVDAAETLDRFMLHGHPDPERFRDTVEPVLKHARRTLRRRTSKLAAFGEMVALLWANGNRQGAIELEDLWNKLAARLKFSLRCGYPMKGFGKDSDSALFEKICSQHSEVIPPESRASLSKKGVIPPESFVSASNKKEKLRLVSSLRQRASTVQVMIEEREKEIAERKEVEEKLRRSEEFARNIVESSIDCVKVLDLDGRIQYMSPSGQRSLEIKTPGEFLDKRWTQYWNPEDQPRAERALATARGGGVGCFQGDSVLASGTKKSWDVRITPALDKNGAIERLVAVSRDITELRTAQQLAIQAEKLAAAGRLAATIAHEINNPLEAVTNFIYLAMTTKGLPKEVCHQLEIADRELARVAQIAQQTLGFYRGNSTDRWIAVADLMNDVMIVYERKMTYKHLETDVCVDPDLKLYCKQGELRQALSNLVANAIDASRPGGKIWLRAHESQCWKDGGKPVVRITLADNGSGMSPEVQKRIFVPFFTTKAEVGTGIGLWATKALIEQQGGYVRFRSRQGQRSGTVMSLVLPITHQERQHSATF
jgi:PAS domain S-box-containing protein